MKQYYNIAHFLYKIYDNTNFTNDSVLINKSKVLEAILFFINDRKWETMANKLLELNIELQSEEINQLASLYDIGLYAFVLALATMSYSDIRSKLFSNKLFTNYYFSFQGGSNGVSSSSAAAGNTGSTPAKDTATSSATPASAGMTPANPAFGVFHSIRLKNILTNIMNNSFEEVYDHLQSIKAVLSLDVLFHRHADQLIDLIMERLILQYILPYKVIYLAKIAEAFHLSSTQIEHYVINLISKNRLSAARIDASKGILHKMEVDHEEEVIKKSAKVIDSNITALKRGILRTSLLRHGVVVDTDNDLANQLQGKTGSRARSNRGGPSGGGRSRGTRPILSHPEDGEEGGGTMDVSEGEDDAEIDEEQYMQYVLANGGPGSAGSRSASRFYEEQSGGYM
jgi:hypothetical protein